MGSLKTMYYESIKQFLISSIITFISTFALAFLPFLGDNTLSHSAIVGGITVAARLAIVAVFQGLTNITKTNLK